MGALIVPGDDAPADDAAPEPVRPRLGAVLDVRSGRLGEDLELAAELGLQMVRIDVPWALAQPREHGYDGDVFESLVVAAQAARAAGVDPWFRLLQPAVPLWFDDEGGFTDDRTAATFWPRWVELVADRLGHVAAGWVPLEAPYGIANRLMPDDARRHGEVFHSLVVAWRDAWRILRGGQPVATSLDVAIERPQDDTPPEREEARRREQLRWGVWFQGFADGIVRIPGRADRELADLQGAVDVIGLALRADVETCVYRTAEQGLDRPLALTYKPTGDTDGERATRMTAMWREVDRATDQIPMAYVAATPFADAPGAPGIVTLDREVKDSGEAFLRRE
ncbi:MAG: family 1 glycosylhydrolase [Ilumatobacteraceae bacterium]